MLDLLKQRFLSVSVLLAAAFLFSTTPSIVQAHGHKSSNMEGDMMKDEKMMKDAMAKEEKMMKDKMTKEEKMMKDKMNKDEKMIKRY